MIDTLASRPASARALLEAIGRGEIAAGELSAFHAGQIRGFEDAALTSRLAAVWGDVRGTAEEKRSLLDRYRSELTPAWLTEGDLSAGRALFEKTCASCHVMYGSGRKLGPDLTGSNRKNLDYLLENIIDPSASVGIDFRTVVVSLADGRVLTGVVSERNERTLVLQTAQGPAALDRHEIEETTPTGLSLMPEGLLQNLSAEQTRDLFAYLMGSEQPPLPEQPE
jgi:putative heme-binding domain-containing protein